jgi:hypothetical protein
MAATQQRQQQRQQRTGGGGGGGNRPWRLCLIRTYTDRAGDEKTHFLPIGAAFKNEQGFSSDNAGLYVDLQRGDRLALFPPDETDAH